MRNLRNDLSRQAAAYLGAAIAAWAAATRAIGRRNGEQLT
jgi:hypothetical protein